MMMITVCGDVLTNHFGCPDDTELTPDQFTEVLDTFDVPSPQRETLTQKIKQFKDSYAEVSLFLGNPYLPMGYISVCFLMKGWCFEKPQSRYLMGIAPDGSVAS